VIPLGCHGTRRSFPDRRNWSRSMTWEAQVQDRTLQRSRKPSWRFSLGGANAVQTTDRLLCAVLNGTERTLFLGRVRHGYSNHPVGPLPKLERHVAFDRIVGARAAISLSTTAPASTLMNSAAACHSPAEVRTHTQHCNCPSGITPDNGRCAQASQCAVSGALNRLGKTTWLPIA
jgi:hypothetical protein